MLRLHRPAAGKECRSSGYAWERLRRARRAGSPWDCYRWGRVRPRAPLLLFLRRDPFVQLIHRGQKFLFEIDPIQPREDEHAPEAIGQLVRQLSVDVFYLANAALRHDEAHEIAA